MCASFGSTRLMCASFGSTRLICAFYGTTRLLCRVRAQRGADRREAGRTREGHMDASGFLIASAMYFFVRGGAKLGQPRCLETTRAQTFVVEHLSSVVRERSVIDRGGTSAVCKRLSSRAWWSEDSHSGGEWRVCAIEKKLGKRK
ncbi:hypothetical protein E5676_scaffold575G00080 [Cucumis melo var. makuwa]|uniref:DNA-directed RNA polymerase I subunit RPA1-like n=1 Tax=Cucumis melo var. makuwa TaxID=1194695 RepID=A0A5A7SRX4_CUCMM|nr:hypothetical protein E6C27_scaffold708G00340 [Cucumis melo var. makuwa]TYK30344.1 hypothetical protein E5676_scaffold575G00080 [Cucumis melo var. makuwa]